MHNEELSWGEKLLKKGGQTDVSGFVNASMLLLGLEFLHLLPFGYMCFCICR
jgi:hypothetical protein